MTRQRLNCGRSGLPSRTGPARQADLPQTRTLVGRPFLALSTSMIGARLGKWFIDKKLGSGGMGDVFLAHELSNDPAETAHGERLAAVKVLAPELARDSGFLSRFRREIEILQQLDHPGIVRFFESGEQDKHVYYAMEYVDS